MKKIAITQRLVRNNNYNEIRESLDINYSKLLNSMGVMPIILPYEIDFRNYFEELDIEGVFLSGGNDIGVDEVSIKRDIYEKELIKYSIDNDISIFGQCRGMQIIGDFFNISCKEIKNHVNTRSKLIVNSDSKYCTYLNKIKEVNSFHNYALEEFSNDFIISAYTKDGTIKAIEHKSKKIFAQMWHSERESPFSENELALIKSFFNIK
jgi:putative glutamine amidotransferase